MCGRATFAIEVSSTSMNVASVTVSAITHLFRLGFQTAAGAERGSGRDSAVAALIPCNPLEAHALVFDAENAVRAAGTGSIAGRPPMQPLSRADSPGVRPITSMLEQTVLQLTLDRGFRPNRLLKD